MLTRRPTCGVCYQPSPMSRGRLRLWPAAVVMLLLAATAAGVATARIGRVHAAYAQECSDSRYPAWRDSSNPLMLRTPPGPNPLNGARFFVDGPRHGSAAEAIAQLLRIDPTPYPGAHSWKRFRRH